MVEPPPPTTLPAPLSLDALELRHLRAFMAVADELNFTRAADRLFVSGPTLSRQIASLERAVGCQLLRRSTHSVELTLAGEALRNCAREVLGLLVDGVAATRAVGGELQARLIGLWQPVVEAVDETTDLTTYRAAVERLHAQFPLAPDLEIVPLTADGVPALRLSPAEPDGTMLLYLHGGGYIAGSAYGYRATAAALLSGSASCAVLPEYRLAPEHRFPAAVDDVVDVYCWLLRNGCRPHQLVLAGDSAGAGLVMSTLLRLRKSGRPMPAGAALLSPWVDLTDRALADDVDGDPDDEPQPVMSRALLRRFAHGYIHGTSDPNGLLTPLTADLTGLPPMLIQAATGDPLRKEAERLADHAERCRVDVQLELYPVTTHDFQLFWSFLPEAAAALGNVVTFTQYRTRNTPSHRLQA